MFEISVSISEQPREKFKMIIESVNLIKQSIQLSIILHFHAK